MAREHPDYRNNIELLNARFPNYDMLNVEEVMQVLNFKTKKTVLKHLGTSFVANRISKARLARYMCGQ